MNVTDNSLSSMSIQVLHETVARCNAVQTSAVRTLAEFSRKISLLQKQRDAARAEAARLKGLLEKSEKERERLVARERALSQEVATIASAIDLASREIYEGDRILQKATSASASALGLDPAAMLAAKAARQAKAQASPAAPASDSAAETASAAGARPDLPRQDVSSSSLSLVREPEAGAAGTERPAMPPADMPAELARSFKQIGDILEEALGKQA